VISEVNLQKLDQFSFQFTMMKFHSFEEIYKSQTKIRLDSEYQMFIMNFIHLEEFGSCHLTINSI